MTKRNRYRYHIKLDLASKTKASMIECLENMVYSIKERGDLLDDCGDFDKVDASLSIEKWDHYRKG